MARMLAIAAAVVADAVRRKVVWIVVVFAALLAFVAPSLPSYGAGVADAVFREVSIALMFAASLVVTIALAASRVPSETERRTVYSILSCDVRRWQYLSGTWLGIVGVIGATLLACSVVTVATGAVVYATVMWRLLTAAFAVWLEMGVIAAMAVALSSRFGVVTSSVGALAFVFIGHSVSTLFGADAHGGGAPWYVPSLEVFDVVNPVAHGTGFSIVAALGMLGAFVAWSVLLLALGTLVFDRRDL